MVICSTLHRKTIWGDAAIHRGKAQDGVFARRRLPRPPRQRDLPRAVAARAVIVRYNSMIVLVMISNSNSENSNRNSNSKNNHDSNNR